MKNDVNGAIAKEIMAFIREEVSREDLMLVDFVALAQMKEVTYLLGETSVTIGSIPVDDPGVLFKLADKPEDFVGDLYDMLHERDYMTTYDDGWIDARGVLGDLVSYEEELTK